MNAYDVETILGAGLLVLAVVGSVFGLALCCRDEEEVGEE